MVRRSNTATVVAALSAVRFLRGGTAQYENCTIGTVVTIGNGRCDANNNNPSCGYDGGDCCECTCADGPYHSCADAVFDCLYPDCGDPLDSFEVSTCYEDMKGDGKCNEYNNTPACEYDGGDCCECSCAYGAEFDCGVFNSISIGFVCKDPACFDPALVAEFPNCTGDWMTIGDEGCDDENNNSACGYDGGDCCECSCSSSRCEGRSLACLDPSADLEIYECGTPPPPTLPCPADVQRTWIVENATEAQALSDAVSCSGGTFEVEWRGTVTLDYSSAPIYVRDGTVLAVSGDGSSAVIDGNERVRLFTVVNATLHLSGVNITSGNSVAGGAIAAAGSTLTLDRVNFIGNNAAGNGGALHVSDGSTVSCVGGGVFAYNTADVHGGAMYVTGKSVVSCGGSWLRNVAGYSAGALMVDGESSMSWSRDTAFRNNRAREYGGAVYANDGSAVSWNASSTVFYSNFGPDFEGGGGAVCAANGSSVSWSGATLFDANFAFKDGGALLIRSGSSVSWSGLTTYVDNALQWDGGQGGAVYVEGNSAASWSANTTYLGNVALLSGGALYASYSSVSWTGDTEFRDNSAGDGGAVCASGSSLSWSGNTTMVLNSAGSGGALSASSGSSVFWSGGATRFANNSATGTVVSSGGALSLVWSDVSWSGATAFVGNTAAISGGAIHIHQSCNVSWTGDTTFESNSASSGDGGAVATGTPTGKCDADSTLVINGTTAFNSNEAGLNGGGLALFAGCALTIDTTAEVSFVGNSASVAGGAVFLSVAVIGPLFTGASFISNSAEIGGAVSIFSSGNSEENPSPTTFNRCRFIGNQATSTGGAINSAAGRDAIDGSVFEGNSAGTGGALRLAGTASVYNCSFVENVSKDGEGPAVSNIGYFEKFTDIYFSGNGFDCPSGTFLDFNNESGDPLAAACDGCEEATCSGCGFVEGVLAPTCAEVVDHSTSNGGNVTLQALSIERGYWRATTNSEEVLACYYAGACLGGVTGTSGYCLEGYEGPYCSICSEGYTEQLSFRCGKCPENSAGGIAVAVVLAVVVLLVAAAAVSYLMSGEAGVSRERGVIERLTQYIPLQSVKIVIVAWQILTQFTSVANVTFPHVYQDFLDILDVFNFDLSWVLSAGCVVDVDFHGRLLISTISPIIALAFLACTYAIATRKHRGAPESIQNIRHKHVSMVLLLSFLVYSSVSSVLFRAFACEKLDDGKDYLRSDYRIECDTSKHKGFQVFAGFMIVLYTVGIPALYAGLLFRDRDVLRKDKEGREEPPRVKSTSDLWKPYNPAVFYYEVIECGRRILLAGVVVFIYPNTAAQIAITLLIAFAFIVISEVLSPYSMPWDAWISRMGHVVVFVSMFIALLLKVDVSDERVSSQKVFEAVLVAVHVCMVVAVVAEAITLSCSLSCSFCPLRVGQREDALPRSRRGLSRQVGGRHPFH